jgi:hypothetical protein
MKLSPREITKREKSVESTESGKRKRRENMQATTEIVVTAEQLFSEMADWHTHMKEELRHLRAKRSTLPEGECAMNARLIELAGTRMVMLRDLGRIALGLDPTENDGNPFGDGDDY